METLPPKSLPTQESCEEIPAGAPLLPFAEAIAPNPRSRPRDGASRRRSEASADSFEAIKRSRVRLYLPLLQVIASHGPAPDHCLTAREILRKLKAACILPASAERNSVSPRLSELLEANCIENPIQANGRTFLKHVTGDAAASVWRITDRGRALLNHLEQKKR